MPKRLYINNWISSDMQELLTGLHVVNRGDLAENRNPLFEEFLEFLVGNARSKAVSPKSKDFDLYASRCDHLPAVVQRAGLDVANTIGRVLPTRSNLHAGWLDALLTLLSRRALQELERVRAEAVIFFTTPHFPWDICLYHAAKELELNVGIVHSTPFDGFSTVSTSLSPSAEDILRQFDEVQLYQVRTNFRRATEHNSRLLDKLQKSNERALCKNNRLRAEAVWVYRLSSMLFGRLPDTSLRRYSQATRWELFRSHLGHTHRVMQLRTLYEKLCSELPSSRFVYLPLHFQPERTTHPEGGIWANQALLIRTIRDALPKEIELVVKEHPVQFANWPPNIRTRHYRSSIFYESIEAIPGVSLLSSEVSTATIGERADFVCTIQGNAALEFIRIGKPAVTMRWTWLDGCEGYFYPHDGQVRRTIEDALELQLQGKNLLRSWDQFRFDAPDHIFNVPSHHSELAVMAGDKNQIARNVGEVADLISSA